MCQLTKDVISTAHIFSYLLWIQSKDKMLLHIFEGALYLEEAADHSLAGDVKPEPQAAKGLCSLHAIREEGLAQYCAY